MRWTVIALPMLGLGLAAPAAAQDPPKLVAAYMAQLGQLCGPRPPGAPVAAPDRADLNGDGRLDWIVDAGREPCPGRPKAVVAAGSPVTIFLNTAEGIAAPAFQTAAFGSRLQRTTAGNLAFWVTVGGADCGEAAAQARCERQVVWRPTARRFELQAPPKG